MEAAHRRPRRQVARAAGRGHRCARRTPGAAQVLRPDPSDAAAGEGRAGGRGRRRGRAGLGLPTVCIYSPERGQKSNPSFQLGSNWKDSSGRADVGPRYRWRSPGLCSKAGFLKGLLAGSTSFSGYLEIVVPHPAPTRHLVVKREAHRFYRPGRCRG